MAEEAKGNYTHPIWRIVSSKIVLTCAALAAIAALFILSALQRSSSTKQPKTTYSTPSVSPSLAPSLAPSTFAPSPTLAPGQKAIYTFYIQATSHKTSSKGLGINPSDTGRTFTVDIGTLLILRNFGIGNFHVSLSSPQDIFAGPSTGLPKSLPFNAIDTQGVFRAGFGTITVVETK